MENKRKNYEEPETIVTECQEEYCFISVSSQPKEELKEAEVEVDEFVNCGEEILTF